MIRRYVVWIGLVTIAAGVVLHMSMQTRAQQDRLAEVNEQIQSEQERIRVLTAEWYSLRNPDRLEALAHRHLDGYAAIKPLQMATLTDVPDPLPMAATPAAPVAVAAAKPATPAVQQTASVATPRARPQPPQPKQDDVAGLISRSQQETVAQNDNDGIRTIIDRDQSSRGVLMARLESGAQ